MLRCRPLLFRSCSGEIFEWSTYPHPFWLQKVLSILWTPDTLTARTSSSVKVSEMFLDDMVPRTYLHGGGVPQGRWGDPPGHIISFYFDHVYMIGGVTRLGGLPSLPGRITLSAGVTFCHVNVSGWGNPPSQARVHGKKLKSETCMF